MSFKFWKGVLFVNFLCFYRLIQCDQSDCEAKRIMTLGAIKSAWENYPMYNEVFACQLAMALDDPNNQEPDYSTCVIDLLYKYVKILPMTMRNQKNYDNMLASLKNKKVAEKLFQCSKQLSDCIDIVNVHHCLKYIVPRF